MNQSRKLDRELALTEASFEAASLAKTLVELIAAGSKRIAASCPHCGLTEAEIASEIQELLLNRPEFRSYFPDSSGDGHSDSSGLSSDGSYKNEQK